jgi:hypothetical protein
MFANPLFGALDIRYGRYVTPWDVALNPDSPAAKKLDAWLAGAQAAGVSSLIAFERRAGDQCPNQPCYLPDPSEFLQAFLAFRAKYPQIKTVSVWNEANHSTQPTFRSSVDAAQLYLVVARHCSGCMIVAADVLDNFSDFSQKMSKWLRTFSSVAPLQQRRNRLLLDGRRLLVADVLERLEGGLGQPEIGECRHVHRG